MATVCLWVDKVTNLEIEKKKTIRDTDKFCGSDSKVLAIVTVFGLHNRSRNEISCFRT